MGEFTVIKDLGLLAEDVYENDLNKVGEEFRGYRVLETSTPSVNGFQALLLKNLSPSTSEPKYIFAFRGTEPPKFSISGVIETWQDFIVTDVSGLLAKEIPSQILEALIFVQDQMLAHSDLTTQNTALTGHSLGGSLATAVSYSFGFDAYKYNPLGIAGNAIFSQQTIGDVFQYVFNQVSDFADPYDDTDPFSLRNSENLSVNLGITVERLEELLVSTQPLTGFVAENIDIFAVGEDYQEFVSGATTDIFGGLMGEFQPVMNHEDTLLSLSGFSSHSIANLNANIEIYNNILEKFENTDFRTLTETICFVPDEGSQVHNFMLSLGKLLVNDNFSGIDNLALSLEIQSSSYSNLQLENLGDKNYSEIQNFSKQNNAEIYALENLNSFLVLGNDSIYNNFDSDKKIKLRGQPLTWDRIDL